jgi:hypothetical protein
VSGVTLKILIVPANATTIKGKERAMLVKKREGVAAHTFAYV